jgi:hypothetical protein
MSDPIARLTASLLGETAGQVALVHGDLVLAEPAAARIAEALAGRYGARVESQRRPPSLRALLQDLRTFSLFGSGKVALAVDTAAFADRSAAADLVDDAEEVLPLAGGEPERQLAARERLAASRLLQALALFDVDAGGAPPLEVLDQLPPWVLEGGRTARRGRGGRARGKRQIEDLRTGLAALLDAARRDGVEANAGGELPDLAAAISAGLPPGHALVFAEREVALDHPLVRRLAERGAVVAVGGVESDRNGWQGVSLLAAEMETQTGVAISSQAMAELARRTLRKPADRGAGGRPGDPGRNSVDAASTARLAGEYRKLANLARGAGAARIELNLVEESIEDRGEEDVWKLLDAIGAGKAGEALDRLRRLLAAADDPLAARLSFFALLATFCRRLTAVRGMMRVARVPAGEANYGRFSSRLAPALQGDLPEGRNPLAGVNTWALHRAYLAAGRLPEPLAARLPWDVLETEMQLKGESSEADSALARLVVHLATAGARSTRSPRSVR